MAEVDISCKWLTFSVKKVDISCKKVDIFGKMVDISTFQSFVTLRRRLSDDRRQNRVKHSHVFWAPREACNLRFRYITKGPP